MGENKIPLLFDRPRPPAPTPENNPPIPPRDYHSIDETKRKKSICVIL